MTALRLPHPSVLADELPREPVGPLPQPARPTLLAAAVLALLGVAAFAVDLPLAQSCRSPSKFRVSQKVLRYGESFGHAIGVVLILTVVFRVDRRRSPCVPRMAASAFGAGLLADVLKLTVQRTRPVAALPDATSVFDTFGGWCPGLVTHTLQSFPSSHTAMAVGLAVALAAYYPRGRWIAGGLAALCAAQRVTCGAHFLSDVCFGAAIGWLTAGVCLRSRVFDPLEARLSGAPRASRAAS